MSEQPDYLAARREWMERYGSYISQAKNWRIAAISAIGIAALFGAGMVYEADRVHVVPYVVEVSKLGKTVELAQAVKAGAYAQPVVRHIVSRFSWLLFSRSPDTAVQKHWIDQSYAYIANTGEASLNAFYSRHHPYAAYENSTGGQVVTIQSAEPLGKLTESGGSFIIDFSVKKYGKHGGIHGEQNWQGTITYANVGPSNNPNILNGNPFGIYITHFAFSRQLG
jgi:type IV secretion system protein VirB5